MIEKNITHSYISFLIYQIPGGMNFATANTNGMANTQVDGIERYCGRVFVANAAASGVAATRSVCSKYFVNTKYQLSSKKNLSMHPQSKYPVLHYETFM
mgnify:FL=1